MVPWARAYIQAQCHIGTVKVFSESFILVPPTFYFFCLFKWGPKANEEPGEQFHSHASIVPGKCIVPGLKGAEIT